MKAGDDEDAVGLRSVEERVRKPGHEGAPRVTVDGRVEHRVISDVVQGRGHRGQELFAQPWPCAFVPGMSVLDVGGCGSADDEVRFYEARSRR